MKPGNREIIATIAKLRMEEKIKIQTRDGLETYTGHPCPDLVV